MKSNLSIYDYYQSKLDQLQKGQKKLRLAAAKIGWLRLLLFLTLAICIWLGFSNNPLFFIGAFLSLAGFLFLVKIHLQKQFEKELGEQKIKIVENELNCLKYEPGLWYNGEKFHSASSFSNDLDIFGQYSVFHYINRCATEKGQQYLAQFLLDVSTDQQSILQRQEAVAEMHQKPDYRLQWQGLSLLLPDKKDIAQKLNENLSFKNEFVSSTLVKVLLFIAPLIAFGSTIFYFITDVWQPMFYAIILNLTIAGFFLSKINKRQRSVDGLQKLMNAYSGMISAYLEEKWNSEILKQDLNEMQEATQAFAELANISEWFDRRMNVVAGVLFNGFILYDLHCAIRLEKWKNKYASKCDKWFNTIAAIDSFQSLGNFSFNHPEFNLPQITDKPEISAIQLAHPLIPADKNIANDFSTSHPEKIILITGSNMSGKSTFLRTVGLNLVLAQAGLPVNAKKMDFHPLHILTSLKQTDNLHENVSLFHAELLRLKGIREFLKKGQLSLVLLDEMLRGTNSEDKLVGSRKLIEELAEENIFALIASHDLELGKLEEKYPGKIRNACFESVITNDELIFDYQLKKGVARNKNATFLLKKLKVINETKTLSF